MSRYWSAGIDQLSPYVPGEQPKVADLIKLNTNESPDDPSPKVVEAIQGAAKTGLRRYSDPRSTDLTAALATYHGVEPQQVFVGNGSDEVLAHAFYAFFRQSKPLLYPDISYSFYPVYAGLYNIETRSLPLDADFAINADDYVGDAGGVIIANPNAPTGRLLALEHIAQIAQQNSHCVVVVDEAYIDFGGESALGLLDRFDNVLVVRTFSKSRALAGLRVGYAIGSAELIDGLVRVKDSFNSYPLDRDEAYFVACCERMIHNREQLFASLQGLGFECLPSAANFIMARCPGHSAEGIAAALRDRNIIVRHFSKDRISEYLRISVGSESECAALVSALAEILA